MAETSEHYEVELLDQVNEGREVWVQDDPEGFSLEQARRVAEAQLPSAFMGRTRVVHVTRIVVATFEKQEAGR